MPKLSKLGSVAILHAGSLRNKTPDLPIPYLTGLLIDKGPLTPQVCLSSNV